MVTTRSQKNRRPATKRQQRQHQRQQQQKQKQKQQKQQQQQQHQQQQQQQQQQHTIQMLQRWAGEPLSDMPIVVQEHSSGTRTSVELRRTAKNSINVVQLAPNCKDFYVYVSENGKNDRPTFRCTEKGGANSPNCTSRIQMVSPGVAEFINPHRRKNTSCLWRGEDLPGVVYSPIHRYHGEGPPPVVKDYLNEEVDPTVRNTDHDSLRRVFDWMVDKEVGKGSFGQVLRVHRETNSYAVKIVPKKEEESMEREALQMRCGQTLRGWYVESKKYSIYLLELATSVTRLLPLDVQRTGWVANQALTGLTYLHDNQIVHRDVKSDNLLIFNSGRVVVADLGGCCILGNKAQENKNVGNYSHRSPEAIERGPGAVAPDRDYWALVVTSYRCLFIEKPFDLTEESTRQDLVQMLDDHRYLKSIQAVHHVTTDELKNLRNVYRAYFTPGLNDRPSQEELRRTFAKWSGFKEVYMRNKQRESDDLKWFLSSL